MCIGPVLTLFCTLVFPMINTLQYKLSGPRISCVHVCGSSSVHLSVLCLDACNLISMVLLAWLMLNTVSTATSKCSVQCSMDYKIFQTDWRKKALQPFSVPDTIFTFFWKGFPKVGLFPCMLWSVSDTGRPSQIPGMLSGQHPVSTALSWNDLSWPWSLVCQDVLQFPPPVSQFLWAIIGPMLFDFHFLGIIALHCLMSTVFFKKKKTPLFYVVCPIFKAGGNLVLVTLILEPHWVLFWGGGLCDCACLYIDVLCVFFKRCIWKEENLKV